MVDDLCKDGNLDKGNRVSSGVYPGIEAQGEEEYLCLPRITRY